MPVVLTGTLRAVAVGDVGSGSCRCLRLYTRQWSAPPGRFCFWSSFSSPWVDAPAPITWAAFRDHLRGAAPLAGNFLTLRNARCESVLMTMHDSTPDDQSP